MDDIGIGRKKWQGSLSARMRALGNLLIKYSATRPLWIEQAHLWLDSDGKTCGCIAGHCAELLTGLRLKSWYENVSSAAYHNGDWLISQALFDGKTKLPTWADKHPELWGNRYGQHALRHGIAYSTMEGPEAIFDEEDEFWNASLTLADVGGHLLAVANNLEARGNGTD